MVDRQDIDALLVGALYGELTPADEARLAAHLESHPGDRAALEDLKTARQAVRESQIFEMQHEPPQAVSALLLQEAHRRAPKPARAQGQHEHEGWFSRLARSFFAHPAMAAAAMLVLVVGVASTIYLKKGGDEFANKEATGAAPAGAAQEHAEAPSPTVAATPPSAGAGSGYAVGLAEDNAALDQRAQEQTAQLQKEAELDRAKIEKLESAHAADDKLGRFAGNEGAADGDRRKASPPAHTAPAAKPPVAINTPSPALQPKDIGSLDTGKARSNAKGGLAYDPQSTATAKPSAREDKSLAASPDMEAPGGAPAQAAPPPPAPAPQKAPSRSAIASGGAAGPAPSTAPAAPPAPKAAASKNDIKPTDPLIAWAQDSLNKAIAFAKNDNCKEAANLTTEIRNKAPAFYNTNVADNRALKGCLPYMRNNVDQAEQRSKKSAPAKLDSESVK